MTALLMLAALALWATVTVVLVLVVVTGRVDERRPARRATPTPKDARP